MRIRGTNAEAKILSTTIKKSLAYVRVLIHASKLEPLARCLRFGIREGDGRVRYLSPINYWLNYNQNNQHGLNDVALGLQKEITVTIDLTAQGKGRLELDRWVKICQIVIEDTTQTPKVVWVSERLLLYSEPIDLPTITSIQSYNRNDYKDLVVKVRFEYDVQRDFVFSNQNLYTAIQLKSNQTFQVLETAILYEEAMRTGELEFVFDAEEPIETRLWQGELQWGYSIEVNSTYPDGPEFEVWHFAATLSSLGVTNETLPFFERRITTTHIEYRLNADAEWIAIDSLKIQNLRNKTRRRYNDNVIIAVSIKNLKGETLVYRDLLYTPYNKLYGVYTNIEGQPKRVVAFYVK